MSIGHFPTPHPEELLYSVCARFQDRVQYPNKMFVGQELFGKEGVVFADLPARLGYFVRALPEGHALTVDQIIEERTLFPIFRPFLQPQRARRVRKNMEGDSVLRVKMGSGSAGTRIRMPDWLRFCPVCAEEDVRRFREPYWHRLHQVSGVMVCPTHLVLLEDSRARLRNPIHTFDYVSAERAIHWPRPRPLNPSDRTHQAFLKIARDAAWFLDQRGLCSGFAALRQRYVHAFFEREICTYTGVMDRSKLAGELRNYYGPDFLRLLRCEISKDTLSNWAAVFIKDLSSSKAHHPLQHLLIIQFLGYTAESFFKLIADYKPFGEGPWPCLNRACVDYQKPVIATYELSFSYSERKRRPVGTFGCKCGFVYYRRGPDTSDEDRLRYDVVKVHGPKWDAALRDLWDNSTLFLEEISLQLYGKSRLDYKVKVQAERLSLRFPRQVETFKAAREHQRRAVSFEPPSAPKIEDVTEEVQDAAVEAQRDIYRAEWLDALGQNPDAPRTLLRDKFSRLYKWLLRHDRVWLKEHLLPPKDHSFDWAGLDAKLAAGVKEAAQYIYQFSSPRRVTVYAIGRYLDKYDYLRHNLDRLPLTAAALGKVVETPADFDERLRRQAEAFFRRQAATTTAADRSRQGQHGTRPGRVARGNIFSADAPY